MYVSIPPPPHHYMFTAIKLGTCEVQKLELQMTVAAILLLGITSNCFLLVI